MISAAELAKKEAKKVLVAHKALVFSFYFSSSFLSQGPLRSGRIVICNVGQERREGKNC